MAWIAPPAVDEPPAVDTEHVRELDYALLATDVEIEDQHLVRCELCGLLFPVEEMPEAVEHLANHDGQGDVDVNPFAIDPRTEHEVTHAIDRETTDSPDLL